MRLMTTNTVPIPEDKRLPNMTVLSVASIFGEAIRCNTLGRSVGKLFAFIAAANVETGWPVATNGYLWLVVIGALTTVIGFAFYLRIVAALFSDEGVDEPIDAGFGARFAIAISATITLVFGIVPWPLLDVVRDALPL